VLPIRRDGQLHELHAVSGITRGLSAPKKGAFGLSRGLSETGPFERPGPAAGLAIWEPGRLAICGAGRRGVPAGPDAAPEWARVQRAGVGHDGPHGRTRRGGGGGREVRSIRPLETPIDVALR
jgi:hypothetical protein